MILLKFLIQKISKLIFPEKIIRNEDKRTSIVIKGIPIDTKKCKVRDFVEKFGNINHDKIVLF